MLQNYVVDTIPGRLMISNNRSYSLNILDFERVGYMYTWSSIDSLIWICKLMNEMRLNFVIWIECEINKANDYTFTLLAKTSVNWFGWISLRYIFYHIHIGKVCPCFWGSQIIVVVKQRNRTDLNFHCCTQSTKQLLKLIFVWSTKTRVIILKIYYIQRWAIIIFSIDVTVSSDFCKDHFDSIRLLQIIPHDLWKKVEFGF